MSTIKQPIQDLLALLGAVQVRNGDGQTVNLFVRMWNNQVRHMEEKSSKVEAIQLPACFLEFVSFNQFEQIGGAGVIAGDMHIKLHIVHEFYDAQDGTMGQDFAIFDLKDLVVRKLVDADITGCSALQRVAESSSNDFDNIHEYVIEYKCNFIDSVSSMYDSGNNRYIQTSPPTNLELTVTKVTSL